MFRSAVPFFVRSALVAAAFGCGSAWADTDQISRLLTDKGLIAPGGAAATPAAAPPFEAASAPAITTTAAPAAAPESFTQHVREKASDMVLTAMNFLGVRYRRGGNDADSGFDCSGFTRHVFESALGLVLPRRADEQAHAKGLTAVKRDDLKPGDLVFFNTLRRTFSHVGIYIGEGKFIHAPKPGGEVRVEDMRFAYWAKRFTGARRAEQADAPVETPAASTLAAAPAGEPLAEIGAVATAAAAPLVAAAPAVPAVLKPSSPPATRKLTHKTRRKPAAKAVKAVKA